MRALIYSLQPKSLLVVTTLFFFVLVFVFANFYQAFGFAITALSMIPVIVAGCLSLTHAGRLSAIFSGATAGSGPLFLKHKYGSAANTETDTASGNRGGRYPVQGNLRDMRRQKVLDHQETLEDKILARSTDLYALNQQIRKEIHARQEAEKEVQTLRLELEKRVRERTRRLETANKELESFSFAVSHDLRSPLSSIIGFSNALLEDCGDSLSHQAHQYMDRIIAASDRMKGKIEALLNFSRMNLTELSVTQVDLSQLACEIMQDLIETSSRDNLQLEIAAGLTAKADKVLLRAVLENLLENAWKYTARKDRTIIRFGAKEFAGETIYFVSDNGAGFDMAHADKLFEPFQRLHRIDEFEGNGIGLTTVKRIINHHGGRVWAEAAVDQGATFYFTIERVENHGISGPLRQ